MLASAFGTAVAYTESDPFIADLIAGQHIDVGDVSIWNDADYLYVKYTTTDGWYMTETHLDVQCELEDIPQTLPNKKGKGGGNPIPGHFMDVMEHDPAVTEYMLAVDIDALGCGDGNIVVAAHAVVEKETVLTEAPYYASAVLDYMQGLRKDGTPVAEARSDPTNGLVFETGRDESNFFSLGFGGWYIAEFSCDIRNGEGNDVKIIEDTWGSYPLEKADVFASQDGTNWVYLGEADNTNRDEIHTISEFDLGDLEWARYIKVVDTTDPAVHNSAADGYDLNAIQVLQDCVETEEETAWGDGEDFPGSNWATYIEYEIQDVCEEVVLWQIGDVEASQMDNPADELNWPGMFGVFPSFPDPFVVGTNSDSEFPWNSNHNSGYATDFDVEFDYDGPTVDVLLTVSWSPGKSANEYKEVYLDGDHLFTTPTRLGAPASGWWNNMEVFQDTFEFELDAGTHTLNFQHPTGDGTLWDFVKLETVCQE